jgi:ADP-ribose pyrophosphatase YjhB (NUDIX family)
LTKKIKIEVSAGGVVYQCENENPKVVLCRHKTFTNKDVWSLPKGWVERGERLTAAALREVKEESGLEGEIIDKLEPIHYWFYHPLEKIRIKKTVHFFLIKATGGNITKHNLEVDEIKWFFVEEAIGICAYKGEKHILGKAKERLSLLCKNSN